MKSANELTLQELRSIAHRVQALLYLDLDAAGLEVWSPEKSWSPDTLTEIGGLLAEYDLVPTEFTFAERNDAPPCA